MSSQVNLMEVGVADLSMEISKMHSGLEAARGFVSRICSLPVARTRLESPMVVRMRSRGSKVRGTSLLLVSILPTTKSTPVRSLHPETSSTKTRGHGAWTSPASSSFHTATNFQMSFFCSCFPSNMLITKRKLSLAPEHLFLGCRREELGEPTARTLNRTLRTAKGGMQIGCGTVRPVKRRNAVLFERKRACT